MKIGVFDSGIGGVTVLKELRTRFAEDDFFYFGDNANLPYGTKSPEQIKALAVAAAKYIHRENIDALVIACNTASCIAIQEIRELMDTIPVFSVVDAGVESIVKAIHESQAEVESDPNPKSKLNPPILILGTRATVRSRVYSDLIKKFVSPDAHVIEQECPLLVPIIEEAWIEHPVLNLTVKEYLKTYAKMSPGVALLACTHYPWIKGTFERHLPGWKVFDSARAMGEALSQHFSHKNRFTKASKTRPAQLQWQFSDPGSVPSFIFSEDLGDKLTTEKGPTTLRIKNT